MAAPTTNGKAGQTIRSKIGLTSPRRPTISSPRGQLHRTIRSRIGLSRQRISSPIRSRGGQVIRSPIGAISRTSSHRGQTNRRTSRRQTATTGQTSARRNRTGIAMQPLRKNARRLLHTRSGRLRLLHSSGRLSVKSARHHRLNRSGRSPLRRNGRSHSTRNARLRRRVHSSRRGRIANSNRRGRSRMIARTIVIRKETTRRKTRSTISTRKAGRPSHICTVRRPFCVRVGVFRRKPGKSSVVVRHVSRAALGGLMAVGIATGCPQNACEKDGYDDRHYDEWGSDIHVQSLDIQIIRRPMRPWRLQLQHIWPPLKHAGLS